MKCIEENFEGCVCSNCVYNPNYAINTPKPCLMVDCDLCEFAEHCDEFFCYSCSGHLTIEEVNKRLEK